MSDRRGRIKVMDDTLELINGLKLLYLHLWGDEGKICIADTFEFVMTVNRANTNSPLNKFLERVGTAGELDSPNRFSQWDFWKLVCSYLREKIWAQIKAFELLSSLHVIANLASLYLSICVRVSMYATKARGQPEFEATRPPPETFIPIPSRTELGGCARSDSLVRSLVF